MPITPRGILKICAAVARSHGKRGEVIAIAISQIDLDRLFGPGSGKLRIMRLKYIYRRTQAGHEYVYFRMPNGRLFRLPANDQSAEFRKHYDHCLRMLPQFRKPSKASVWTLPKNTA